MTPVAGAECARCGHVVFPRLLLCPRCAGSRWRRRLLEHGTVEETTEVHRMPGAGPLAPVRIGSVRADEGPLLVARLKGGVSAGDRVLLEDDGGAPVARKPQTAPRG